jgi:effector-binding domain-containing protein
MSEFDALEFTEVEVPAALAAQMPGQCAAEPAAIAAAVGEAFGKLTAFVGQYALRAVGPPRTIYTAYVRDGVRFVVALPIAAPPTRPVEAGSGLVETLPAKKAMRFTHRGPYANLATTYGRITAFLQAKGLMPTEGDCWARYMPMWEEYLNDPRTTPEAELLTYICLPVP